MSRPYPPDADYEALTERDADHDADVMDEVGQDSYDRWIGGDVA